MDDDALTGSESPPDGDEHQESQDQWDQWALEREEKEARAEEKAELARAARIEAKRLAKERSERAEQVAQRNATLTSLIFFVLGTSAFGVMSFLFKESFVAVIPLLGMALFIVCWIPFQKFTKLERIEAVFEPNKLRLGASNQKNELADHYARLQSRKAELEIAVVERQIELLDARKKKMEEKKIHRLGSGG